jgi:hypothetical protein
MSLDERGLQKWEIDMSYGPTIERQLQREFRRRYQDSDRDLVQENTFYCLALMQHHGAPTRLLDCTYSPFVAAHNAVKDGAQFKRVASSCSTDRELTSAQQPARLSHVIWCFRGRWLDEQAAIIVGRRKVEARNSDIKRDLDRTFVDLYQSLPPKEFVLNDTPLLLNERLAIQQGTFLCPGNIKVSFIENLKKMKGLDSNVIKFELSLRRDELINFARKLKVMNISSAALFPGLDGFCRSLEEQLFHFKR